MKIFKMAIRKLLAAIFLFLVFSTGYAQKKDINVFAFVAEDCPISIFMATTLKAMGDSYKDRINFYLVFPFATSDEQTARLFKEKNKLVDYIIKIDRDQSITKRYHASVTPEVIVTGLNEEILYKGRINDAYLQPGKRRHIYTGNDFVNALDKIANGIAVPKPWKPAVGCYITQIK